MSFITADFETFYGDGLGFKTQTNEEYLRDPRFEVIGVSVKVDDEPAVWFSGPHEAVKNWLQQFDWQNSALLAHNTLFDGAILAWHFGIVPAFYYDTLSMARAIRGVEAGGSLKKLATDYGIGQKGDEVLNAYNKRRIDFTEEELERYGAYCRNDTELTYKLFQILHEARPVSDLNPMESFKYYAYSSRKSEFPQSEYDLIDMTLRMYIQPMLRVDDALLVTRLDEIRAEKSQLLSGLMGHLGVDTEEAVRKKLSSNPQFAALLKELGVEPPMKVSPRTGKDTFALAKKDEGFLELMEHPEPVIQQLCAVRMGTKSTIEESRITRFIDIGARNRGYLPVPLKYYGAHTGRWSGMDSVNFQNIPTRDKKKKALKRSVIAPLGHVVINSDSSQIEARVLAWLAGQTDLIEQFRRGEDVYSIFATKIFKRPVTKSKETEVERFVGKTCLAEGTLVLTERGEIPIEEIKLEDRVWDGVEWVPHSGIVCNGVQEVITYDGLTATPDHGVFTEYGPLPFGIAASEMAKILASGNAGEAVRISEDYLPRDTTPEQAHLLVRRMYELWCTEMGTGRKPAEWEKSWLSKLLTDQIKTFRSIRATVRRYFSQMQQPGMLHLQALWSTGDTIAVHEPYGVHTLGRAAFASSRLQWDRNRQTRQQRALRTGNFTVSHTQTAGAEQAQYSKNYVARKRSIVRRLPLSLWEKLDVQVSRKEWFDRRTNPRKVRVYDILNAGPRRRFTANGRLVFNCILGLGYGTGAIKLQNTLATGTPSVNIPIEQAIDIVSLYRVEHYCIPNLWQDSEACLRDIMAWPDGKEAYWLNGIKGAVEVTPEGFRLPNGFYIRYPGLRRQITSRGHSEFVYESRKGPQKIWGGTVVENIVQALARIIVGEQMLAINKRYRVALTVHDAAVTVVPEAEREEAIAFMTKIMSTPPLWAPLLPVACEAKWGPSYGDC